MVDFPYSDRSDAVFVLECWRPAVFVRDSGEGFVLNPDGWVSIAAGELRDGRVLSRDEFLEYVEAARPQSEGVRGAAPP